MVKTWQYTFRNGRRLQYRQVSHHLAGEVRTRFPPPAPPTYEVEIGGEIRQEQNPTDPAYRKALEAWDLEQQQRYRRLYLMRGVVHTLSEAEQQEVGDLREAMRTIGIELDESNLYVYVYHLCIGGSDEEMDFLALIASASQPTEEAIVNAMDEFRDHVSGSADRAAEPASVGGAL